ncbi:MAG TPA: hypothetical protein VKT49_01345 [Bryobacteraceae bacterium]|nr:hypothetical protein [Bryobacteraceae bacterium]
MPDTEKRREAARKYWVPAALWLAFAGCGSDKPVAVPAESAAARLNSSVYTGDPNAAAQLVSGFYRIEEYSWRWTTQRFSVVLRPPEGGNGEGARLVVQLGIPEPVIQRLHSISLSAMVGGSRLDPETYTRPGNYQYVRAIAPKLLSEETHIDFELDKVLPPVGQDTRRLGIVVTSIALEPQ